MVTGSGEKGEEQSGGEASQQRGEHGRDEDARRPEPGSGPRLGHGPSIHPLATACGHWLKDTTTRGGGLKNDNIAGGAKIPTKSCGK